MGYRLRIADDDLCVLDEGVEVQDQGHHVTAAASEQVGEAVIEGEQRRARDVLRRLVRLAYEDVPHCAESRESARQCELSAPVVPGIPEVLEVGVADSAGFVRRRRE